MRVLSEKERERRVRNKERGMNEREEREGEREFKRMMGREHI